mgnify:CR=1 FL=1
MRVRAELAETAGLEASAREAAALLLLTTAGATRLARAYADREASGVPVGFEVVLSAPVAQAEIGHALGALSSACSICRRELAALRDGRVARAYLAVNGRGE